MNWFRASWSRRKIPSWLSPHPVISQSPSGVSQGSIISPLLHHFMNAISKLPLSLGAKLVLYVDDILFYKLVNSDMGSNHLRNDVDTMDQVILPYTKSLQRVSYSTSPDLGSLCPTCTYLNEGRQIPPSQTVKYLESLFHTICHGKTTSTTYKTTKRQVGLIHLQFHQPPPEVRYKIISSVVVPKIEYCAIYRVGPSRQERYNVLLSQGIRLWTQLGYNQNSIGYHSRPAEGTLN